METVGQPRDHKRRNRLIAMAAGAITVVAMVLGFAGDFLGLGMRWMRPAAELLLLAELVGLVVLERHQLFEPVHEKVDTVQLRVEEMHAMMTETARNAGQVTVCASTPEVFATGMRVLNEAIVREQPAAQILRIARLSGNMRTLEDADLRAEFQTYLQTLSSYFVTPDSPPDARARRWSLRAVFAITNLMNFDLFLEQVMRPTYAKKPSNVEIKILANPRMQAVLAPMVITDRDVVITFDDATASFKWGLRFQGREYRAMVERWFDDLWSSISDRYIIYSRNGFNEAAIERIRKELAAMESAQFGQSE